MQQKIWRKNKVGDLSNQPHTIKKIVHKASSNRKLYVFLFCLGLSIFFWLLNALSKNFTTEADFDITYINQPLNKVVLNDLPKQIKIKIKGLGFDLMAYQLRLKRSNVNVDLSRLQGLNKSTQNITLSSTSFAKYISNQLGEQIEVKEIYPDSILFLFDEQREKKVKIIALTQLNFKQQFQLYGKILVKPAITTVNGPASILDTLSEIYTEELVLNELAETTTQSIQLNEAYAAKKIVCNPNKVLIHIPVEKFTESSKSIPLTYVNVPDSIEIKAIPAVVELKFLLPLSKMANLGSADFAATIDYQQINNNFNHKLKVQLTEYPDYIQSTILNPGKVEYILKKRK